MLTGQRVGEKRQVPEGFVAVWEVYVQYTDVSENSGTPKSSILIGFSIINHPFWGTPIFGNTHIGDFLDYRNQL